MHREIRGRLVLFERWRRELRTKTLADAILFVLCYIFAVMEMVCV